MMNIGSSDDLDSTQRQFCTEIERQTLDAITAMPDRPRAMEPFDRYFVESRRQDELKLDQHPVVGQLCHFAPDEIIWAMGAVSLRIERGCAQSVRACEGILPMEVCCAVRAVAGSFNVEPLPFPRLDLLIVPTCCDGKRKLASVLSDRVPVWVLELPYLQEGERSRRRWLGEIHSLIKRLGDLTGKKLTDGHLRQAILLSNRRTQLARRMNELRSLEIVPIRSLDAFLVLQASFTADPAWWVGKTEALVRELEVRAAKGRGYSPRARLLLTGSPVLWPDYKLLQVISETGAEVVADDLCSASASLYHPTQVDEWNKGDMIRACADKTLLACTCPCFSSDQNRRNRLLELMASHHVQGVIHHTLRLCQLFDIDALKLTKQFREQGLPFLVAQTEFGPEESSLLKNRTEAFIEMVVAKA